MAKRTYLVDGDAIPISPTIALMYDINTAAFLQQLHMLLTSVEKLGRSYNYLHGRWWIFYTYDEWAKKFLPWTSGGTVRRIVSQLEDDLILMSTTDPRRPTDRTKWYTIDYKVLRDKADAKQDEISNCSDATAQNAQFLDDSKLNSSNDANSTLVNTITSSDNEHNDKKPVAPNGATDSPTITDIYHAAATNPVSIDDFTTTADSLTNADTRKQPFEALKDEITAVWGWDNQGVLTNIAKMLAGKFKERDKASEYKTYQFDTAMTADELHDWSAWYRRVYPKMSLPQKPDTIAKSIGEYRAQKTNGASGGFDYKSAFTFVEG